MVFLAGIYSAPTGKLSTVLDLECFRTLATKSREMESSESSRIVTCSTGSCDCPNAAANEKRWSGRRTTIDPLSPAVCDKRATNSTGTRASTAMNQRKFFSVWPFTLGRQNSLKSPSLLSNHSESRNNPDRLFCDVKPSNSLSGQIANRVRRKIGGDDVIAVRSLSTFLTPTPSQ